MLYFAYGSNMSTPRLRARVESARMVAVAQLPGHRLKFRKVGQDGSAKCDIVCTGADFDLVHGVVFEIPQDEKPLLDRCEGLGYGYVEKPVALRLEGTNQVVALTYHASDIDEALKPFDWYKQHVLRGAQEHRLPSEYVARIEAVAAIDDQDARRRARELAIYASGDHV